MPLWAKFPDGRRVWRSIATWSKRLEVVAKPITYLLASFGLLSVYFPGLKRYWEEIALPPAWYQVGALRLSVEKDKNGTQSILMGGGNYDAAAWNGGIRLSELMAIKGQDIRTDATVVGRDSETIRSGVAAVLPANQCLHVRDVSLARFRPAYSRGDQHATDQEAGVRLSSLKQTDYANAEVFIRGKIENRSSCQPLTAQEQKEATTAAQKTGEKWTYSYRVDLPVCQRINVWVKATKLSC